MLEQLAKLFSLIVQPAYDLTGSWWAAIFLFTLATKIILMPLALWTQQNSIVMVKIMPEIFRLKARYFGDREAIEERQNELNKKAGYHPLLSLIPLAIQVVILFGLVDVIHGITDSGAPGTEFLGMTPIIDGGITWIMPLAAALSSVALGLASNKINPLQREQSRAEKNTTNGLSIAMSLVLAIYVVCGMAFYWVCSNLLSILVQVVCNLIIDPRKQVDYEVLNEAREEYEAMEKATKSTRKWFQRDPHAAREKDDYARFFNTIGKHLVFYSESSGFYKYFRGAIEWLLSHSDIHIHYVTSDPNDQVFEISKKEPRLIPYYLGQRRLITLFMKMDADVVVTSLGDLESSYMKRSYVRKDAEYMYMPHHMTSMTVTSTRNEYTYYDDVLCVGPHQQHDLELLEAYYHTTEKRKPAIGYDLLDRSIADYEKQGLGRRDSGEKPLIVIGPSWQFDNIMDSCIDDLLKELMGHGWRIVVRPHPEYIKRYRPRMDEIMARYADADPSELTFETDFTSNTSVLSADLLITDWSSVAEEFSFTTLRPSVFIDTKMKENNPEWSKIHSNPCDITLRNEIGRSFDPQTLSGLADAVAEMFDNPLAWSDRIKEIRSNMIFNLGHGGEAAGKFILDRVLAHQEEQRAQGEQPQEETHAHEEQSAQGYKRKHGKRIARAAHDATYVVMLVGIFLCATARPAFAYVDPSVMTYTIQALAAVAVALSAVLGVAFRRSRKVLFRLLHIDENVNKVVEDDVRRVDEAGAQQADAHMREILAQEQAYMRDRKEGRLKPMGRFFSGLLVTAFSVYTVLVVAPLELVARNAADLAFSLQDVFVPVVLAGLAVTLIVTLILTALRGRAFNIALSLVGGLGLCAYIQAMFMNGGMPLADGHEVIWSEFTRKMVISGVVWVAILVALVVFIIIRTRQTRTALLGIAVALIIIQTVGVASLWGPAVQTFTDVNAKTVDSINTTREGLYDVSSKKTVVVFVLDTTDTDEIRTLRESYPETFAHLTGFTWYSNTAGSMIPTRYGIPSLLSGVRPTDTNEKFKDFFYSWYQRSTFLDDVNKLGYAAGVYSDSWRDEKPENKIWMRDRTMNIHPLQGVGADDQLDVGGALRILYKAAFCRDAPWIMKPRFWYYTEDLNQRMRKEADPDKVDLSSQPYHEDDLKYYNELKHYKLRIHDEENTNGSFRFIHLMGSHPPFHLNHNMEETQDEAEQTEDEQTRGMFKIIDAYIQYLKDIGAYDNTSIIITADHGRWYLTPEDIKTPSAPCIFYKPAQSAELDAQPMKVSDAPVWHYDILPQVLKDMGADRQMLSNYTTPLDEVKEGEDRPRYYYETLSDGKRDTFIKEFVINGDANDMNNWQLTGKEWPVGDDW